MSNNNYKNLFHKINLGVVYQDHTGKIIDANAAASEILGFNLAELQELSSDSNPWDPIKEDGSPFPGHEHPVMEALRTGQPVSNVIMGIMHPKKKKRVWLRIDSVPEFEEEETKASSVFATFADITENFELHKKQEKTNRRFRTLFENSPIGVAYHKMIYDDNHNPIDYYYELANEKFKEFTGSNPCGKKVSEVFPGIENDPNFDWFTTFNKAAQYGETIRFQQFLPLNNRWYDIVAFPNGEERFVVAFLEITEQKKTEEKLAESEERYKIIVDNAPEAIVILDADKQVYIDANKNAEKLFGRPREELLNRNPSEFSPVIQVDGQNSLEAANTYLAEALKGEPQRFEWYHINNHTNKTIHCEIQLVRLPSKNRKLLRGSIIDLSELKNTEHLLEKVFNSTQDAIVIHDLEGKVLEVNGKMCEYYQLSKKEASEITIKDISALEMDFDELRTIWEHVIKGEKIRFEWKAMRPKDQSTFDVEVSLQRIGYLNNEYILGNIRDISERKLAEEKIITANKELKQASIELQHSNKELENAVQDIEKSRARVTSIIENTTESIWAINNKYEIIYLNKVFQDDFLSSFDVKLDIGTNLIEALPSFLVPVWKERYDRALNNERFDFEDKIEIALGKYVYIQVCMNPIVADGKVIGASMFGSDITNRKEIEQEIIAANEELQATTDALVQSNTELEQALIEARRSKELEVALKELKAAQSQLIQSEKLASLGILTAGVAHEINNPLNYILGGYTGLFNYFNRNTHTEEEKVQTLLESIKTGVDRAAEIVRGLNQFSREQNNFDEKCDVHAIVNNCLAMLNNQLKHRIEVKKDFSSESIVFQGNVGKLHQLFINILSNAEQAIQDEGFIAIHTFVENKQLHVHITDSGTGMDAKTLQSVTDPFYSTKEPGKGTGLGMSIALTIVNEHNGSLGFISNVGEGTTVKITFPLKA